MPKNKDPRLSLISLFFLVVGGIFVTKLFLLQIVQGDDYRARANEQYSRPVGETFSRGTIYFSPRPVSAGEAGKRITAAALQTEYALAINPSKLKNLDATYNALTALAPLDYADFLARAEKVTDPFEELASHLKPETAEMIEALDLPGVILVEGKERFYPGGTLAAHLLGFVGYESDTSTQRSGLYGLEKYYDQVLSRGETPRFSNILSKIFLGGEASLPDPSDATSESGDIITTIEPTVEHLLEDTLAEVSATWQSKVTGGIIMDPETGEIIALAAYPTFEPGGKKSNIEHLANPLVERVYELGSIMKPVTMSAGLDAGVVTPKTTYSDLGFVNFGEQTIWNYDHRGRGVVPMQEVLNQSLNTGAIYVMQQLGRDRFKKYFQDFGLLNEQTGVDLPGELSGLSDNLNNNREVEYATASFGQGIAVTPLAMTAALSALANGGRLMRPFVAREIDYATKPSVKTEPEVRRQVISEEAADTITQMLVTVVDKALLGGGEKLDRYQVAAKTGTAQMQDPTGGYYADRYLHSFFGYFPASKPRFSIFLFTVDPQGVEYASQTLTKPFFNLTKFLLNYYQVPPDR